MASKPQHLAIRLNVTYGPNERPREEQDGSSDVFDSPRAVAGGSSS